MVRLGIYADDGTGVPTGAPILDAGTISTGSGDAGNVATGGTPGVYEITVSTTLQPGLYWIGGGAQGVGGSGPTMRVVTTPFVAPIPMAAKPTANQTLVGYQMTLADGPLPTWRAIRTVYVRRGDTVSRPSG